MTRKTAPKTETTPAAAATPAPTPVAPDMMTIDRLAREHADARAALEEVRETIVEEVRAIKRRHHPRLKGLAAQVIATRDVLESAIDASRELFASKGKKTQVLHALKLGLRKEADSWDYNKAAVIGLIKEFLPDKAALLIDVVETPVALAIRQLEPAELALIGVVMTPGEDVVTIKPVDTGVDKWIEAIVKEVDKEGEPA